MQMESSSKMKLPRYCRGTLQKASQLLSTTKGKLKSESKLDLKKMETYRKLKRTEFD